MLLKCSEIIQNYCDLGAIVLRNAKDDNEMKATFVNMEANVLRNG